MARIWDSGAELNSTSTTMEVYADGAFGSGGTIAISSTTKRTGSYSFRTNPAATYGQFNYRFANAAANGPFYFRFYVNIATASSAIGYVLAFWDTTTSEQLTVRLDTARKLQVYDSAGTARGNLSAALSLNTWELIEVSYDGAGVVSAKLNGTTFCNVSIAPGAINNVFWGIGVGNDTNAHTADLFWDDIAINDNTGSFQNTYPGEGGIIHLRPNATGDNDGWIGTWADIDEVTPDDATTVIQIHTLNTIEDVNIDNTPAAIGASDIINCIQVGIRSRDEAQAANAKATLRIKASSGGTVEESAEISSTNSFNTNSSSVPRNYPFTLYDLPGASTTPWTKAGLDSAQIGVKCSTAGTSDVRENLVTALWLLVDYKPGVAVATQPQVSPVPNFAPAYEMIGY